MTKYLYDKVYIFDTDEIVDYLNRELITIDYSVQTQELLQYLTVTKTHQTIKDTLIYNAIRNVLNDLGYIISGDIKHYNTKYSNLVKMLHDLYYPYIVNYIDLEIENGYLIRTLLVNSSTHLIITKVKICSKK